MIPRERKWNSPDKKSTPQNDGRIHLKQVWKGADGTSVCSVYLIMYRVSQKNQKSEFCYATNPSGFHRLDEPPKKNSAL